jgi:phosphoribosyl 1,2-cyclic phosphodiesterase
MTFSYKEERASYLLFIGICKKTTYPIYWNKMKNAGLPPESLTFLGTGGARFMIISQLLASGGIWMNLAGTEILLDPGPGCIVQATKRKLRPEKLSAIIVSHRHLDHSGDVNVMVEGMTEGGLNRHGRLFAPADALSPEPVIFSYLRKNVEDVVVLEEKKSYTIGNVTFTTPVRHQHPVETYGMVFKTPKHTFSYIADTSFFKGIIENYKAEMLIINTLFLEPRSGQGIGNVPIEHLSAPDAVHIISEMKPRIAILTHFGMSMWRAKPWEVAERISQTTGTRVIAARDGMIFDLAELDEQSNRE